MHRIVLLFALTFTACGSASAPTTEPAPVAAPAAVEGQRHDPPIDGSEVPDGSWMCDMGTVHYSSAEKHDGKCPVCGMALTQK